MLRELVGKRDMRDIVHVGISPYRRRAFASALKKKRMTRNTENDDSIKGEIILFFFYTLKININTTVYSGETPSVAYP